MLLDLYMTVLQTCLPSPACMSRKGLLSLNTGALQAGGVGTVREAGPSGGGRTRWECTGNHRSQEGREAGLRLDRNELIQISTSVTLPPTPSHTHFNWIIIDGTVISK